MHRKRKTKARGPYRETIKTQSTMKNDVYKMVTDRIIEELGKGRIPWRRPWKGGIASAEDMAISYTSRRAYSLLNQWLLDEPGEYLTYKQISELGGKVRKGAKSKWVVFFTQVPYKDKNKDGEEVVKSYPLLRYYNVFHIKDTEGIKSKVVPGERVALPQGDEAAENIIAEYIKFTGLKFQNNKPSDRAFYQPGTDKVVVPMMSQYEHLDEYYSTTFHELVHSTMKKDRCDREVENDKSSFGNHEYSREELVAETGSAMLCSALGLDTEKAFKNSIGYLQSWIRSFENDPKMIVWAAARAEKAARFILNPKAESEAKKIAEAVAA